MARYRVVDNVNLPLRIIPAVQEEGRARVMINLKISADFSYKLFGSNIVVKVRRPTTSFVANEMTPSAVD